MADDENENRRSNPEGEGTFIRITNAVVYAELQATRADVRDLAQRVGDYPELKKRVRSLELKFYGTLAGLVTALAVIASGVLPR